MTVTLASRARPSSAARLSGARLVDPRLDPRTKNQQAESRRDQLQRDAKRHDQAARMAAELGDTEASARAILALLDCERRLASAGPQVLQVIKPRS